jgi:hypothetical protein
VGKISLEGYRKQWPRVGGILAMALSGATGRLRRSGRRDL